MILSFTQKRKCMPAFLVVTGMCILTVVEEDSKLADYIYHQIIVHIYPVLPLVTITPYQPLV